MKARMSAHKPVGNSFHDHRMRGSPRALWVRSPEHRRKCQRRERWPWPIRLKDGSPLPRS